MAAAGQLQVRDLGFRLYAPVLLMQKELLERRQAGRVADTLLLVEHEPVYTLGRNASEQHILYSAGRLAEKGIRVVRTDRGGDVTYHGPGQLVGYPILKLPLGSGAVWFVDALEEMLILTLSDFGITAGRDSRNRGVWVGNHKIAAIGVRVSRRVTMHGFALNVSVDLSNYEGIVPCGIRGADVTSMHRQMPGGDMRAVKSQLVRRFCEVLGYAC